MFQIGWHLWPQADADHGFQISADQITGFLDNYPGGSVDYFDFGIDGIFDIIVKNSAFDAEAVIFFASDQTELIPGQVLQVGGGNRM